MAKNETFARIVEWVYVNDGMFKSKNEWRVEFIKMLRTLLCYEDDNYLRDMLSATPDRCLCTNMVNANCPKHGLYKN
jgi:hypothetical protein